MCIFILQYIDVVWVCIVMDHIQGLMYGCADVSVNV